MPITRIEAAEFLSALHQQAPADAPANPTRGIPLAGLKENVDDWFQVIAHNVDADAAREVWQKAVAAPAWQGPALWLHGDLHPANVVVRDGKLAGVIAFDEMCAGDPATDLSAAWILLPPERQNGSSMPTRTSTKPPSHELAGGLSCAPWA
jgi:aminoglycoside phosphotransferase (APT) family kinase protein